MLRRLPCSRLRWAGVSAVIVQLMGCVSEPLAAPRPERPGARQPSQEDSAKMQSYRDERCGFEIRHPPDYVVEQGSVLDQRPQPMCKLRFQSRRLAESQLAAFQPPRLSIEVYANDADQPLQQWLGAQRLVGPKDQVEPFSLAGATGLRVTSPMQMAPNQFLYLARPKRIYRLIVLDPAASQMLTTLQFLP